MDFNNFCLGSCAPKQIINLNGIAFNDISGISITDQYGNEYDLTKTEIAYSLDNVCWSCYMNYSEFVEVTAELMQDYYIRFKINGQISEVKINDEVWSDYSTQLDSTFNLTNTETSSNLYNPYINMDCALQLYQNLTESVSNMLGVGCYYFKLSPNTNSRDLTFKEYALMDVAAVKQVKLIINDNQMPSSRPEFNDFGLDWQTDWEVEISKVSFATAFGNKIQPTEGDLVYIPMMKRMWMVNGAWEEKKDAFMWNATTFKVTLVKYQEKDSVNLGDTENLVNSFVKNKYEDLFGDEENVGSGFAEANMDEPYMGKLYKIYESDAVRKSIDINNMKMKESSTYYKGTLISDMIYTFINPISNQPQLEYQYQYCGSSGTLSFIIKFTSNIYSGNLIKIGNLIISIKQNKTSNSIKFENVNQQINNLKNDQIYFVWFKWDKQMNLFECGASEYLRNTHIPLYKLQPAHYWYELDKPFHKKISKYNIELNVQNKSSLQVFGFYGTLTNIKLFDIYITDTSEILQMYPTNNHLIINDTARKIISSLNGSDV